MFEATIKYRSNLPQSQHHELLFPDEVKISGALELHEKYRRALNNLSNRDLDDLLSGCDMTVEFAKMFGGRVIPKDVIFKACLYHEKMKRVYPEVP